MQSLETIIFEIGLHGGDVHITKDIKKSTNGKDIPIKPVGFHVRLQQPQSLDEDIRIDYNWEVAWVETYYSHKR